MWLWSNVDLHTAPRQVRGGEVVSLFAASRYWHADGDLDEAMWLFLTDQDGPISGVVAAADFAALVAAARRLQRREHAAHRIGHAQ